MKQQQLSRAGAARSMLRLLYWIWRGMPVLASAWLCVPLGLGLLVVFHYAAQKELFDVIASGAGKREFAAMFALAAGPLVLLTAAALLRVILAAVQSMIDSRLRDRATMLIQSEVHAKAVSVPLERMDHPDYGDRLQRAESTAGADLFGALQQTIATVQLVCELIGLAVVAALAHPVVGLALVLIFAVSFGIRLESDLMKRRLNRDLTRSGRESDYLRDAIVRPETVRDMRISGSMDYLIDRWSGLMRESLSLRMNANRREIRRGMIVSALQITGLFGVIVWLALQMKSGGVTAGTLVVVFQAMRQAYGISASLAFPIGKIYIQGAKLYDLVEFLSEAPEPSIRKAETVVSRHESGGIQSLILKRQSASSPPLPLRQKQFPGAIGRIAFEDVTYRYAGAAAPVLHGIRLTLHPGETVALVGENGAGKSTLVRLLLGLYKPTEGTITWDGVDFEGLDPVKLRQSMSAAFQDFVRYETTLRDNVGFGLPDAAVDDAALRQALRLSGAEGLEAMLGGLDARTGLTSEGGRELSGGQWQRLAIARAALRDAKLLVLDEPTAALDPQHETELYRSFRELARGRTVLFVSHRLGWARFADRIVVLRDGRIVEQGPHETLLAAGGEYAGMFRAQAAWYQEVAG